MDVSRRSGRWRWFRGTIARDRPTDACAIEEFEPCSFGPEGVDPKVVRARRRSLGRPVLDEDRVRFAETALRSRVKDAPRFPITRVGRERIEGNTTVFDFASLGRTGTAPRTAIWYVGTVRVDLDTFAADADVREAPPHVRALAEDEEAWLALGFPPNDWYLSDTEKRQQIIAALREIDPLFSPSQLGHLDLHGQADRYGAFHFSAEVWRHSERGGSVRSYHGVIAPEGKSKITSTLPVVYGPEGSDGVELRRLGKERNLELPSPDPFRPSSAHWRAELAAWSARYPDRKLQSLVIDGGWDEDALLALWNGIDPVALEVLRIHRIELGDGFLAAVAATASSGRLDALEVLDLAGCSLTSVASLLASPPPNLRVLRLENNQLTEPRVRELTQHALVRRLRELGISNNHVYTGEHEDRSAYGYDAVSTPVIMDARAMRAHCAVNVVVV